MFATWVAATASVCSTVTKVLLGLSWSCTPDAVYKAELDQPVLLQISLCVLQQYWSGSDKYKYVPVATFADAFLKTDIAKESRQHLEQPYKAPNKKCEEALITHHYALTRKYPILPLLLHVHCTPGHLYSCCYRSGPFCVESTAIVRLACKCTRPAWLAHNVVCASQAYYLNKTVMCCLSAVLQRVKALMWREFTLIKRTFVIYRAKTIQVVVTALVAATLFLRTHIHPVSPTDGQEIAGYLFFATLVMLFNGIAELSQSVSVVNTPSIYAKQAMRFMQHVTFAMYICVLAPGRCCA